MVPVTEPVHKPGSVDHLDGVGHAAMNGSRPVKFWRDLPEVRLPRPLALTLPR